MGHHGYTAPAIVRGRVAACEAALAMPVRPEGFRHFTATEPLATETYGLGGQPYDPADPAMRSRAERLMRKLARRMQREPTPAGGVDNPGLPAGYTYLTQLVAHDMVHSTAFLSLAEGRLPAVANTRLAPLRLETIYGAGPAARSDLYEPDALPNRFRPLLRVGPLRTNETLAPDQPPTISALQLDIARGTCPFSSLTRGLPEAHIGDPRNDDHPLLSQLAVLFHHLHNSIFRSVASAAGHPAPAGVFDADHVDFICARAATTMIYRNVVRHDLLQRLLAAGVRDAYENGRVPVVDRQLEPGERWRAPLELTNGVMRALHTMIRPSYLFNKVGQPEEFTLKNMLLQGSDDSPHAMPLQIKWAVDWKQFFGTLAPNRARRIRPHYDAHLFDEQVFPAENNDNVVGLAYRDLISSIDGKPWSLGALVARLRPTHDELLAQSPLLKHDPATAKPWLAPIAAWLAETEAPMAEDAFTAAEIRHLAEDPPLGFYFAFEAAFENAADPGRHLGTLGSIILADVAYNILRLDPLVQDELDLSLQARMAALSELIFGRNINLLGFVPEIRTFSELLAFMKPRMPQAF